MQLSVILRFCTASLDNWRPTFRDSAVVPSSMVECKFCNNYFSSNCVSVIRSRRKRKQAGQWARKGEKGDSYSVLVGKTGENGNSYSVLVGRTGENGNSYSVLVGKTGERGLRRSNFRWENNIKTDLKEKNVKVWIGFIWYKTGTSGGLL